jgi:Leucine-rich repeat (LRR) protein
MKKTLLAFGFLLLSAIAVNAQNVFIPDANFKAALVANLFINSNADAEIQVSEASVYNGNISVSNLNISDLTGIEAFPLLYELDCSANQLSTLDLTSNAGLVRLTCYNNLLNSLDLSSNTILEYLYCSNNLNMVNLNVNSLNLLRSVTCDNNQLSNLDLTTNDSLNYVNCSNNNIVNLDVNSNLALQTLNCSSNQLTSLDISNNYKLQFLDCASNNLSSIDLSNNTLLEFIDCSGIQTSAIDLSFNPLLQTVRCEANFLSNLDVSFNPQLIELRCGFNQLSNLDLSTNSLLENLSCSYNQISNLLVNNNTLLSVLDCGANQLTSLDVTNNSSIGSLWCYSNQISALDVSNCGDLTDLLCYGNLITSLDLRLNPGLNTINCDTNQLSSLTVKNGTNTNLTAFSTLNNPSLSCIEVDDVAYSTASWSGGIDAGMYFSTSCSATCTVNIPDAIFKAALIADLSINTNSNTEIECSEAASYTGAINVSGLGISDLTGIEAFTAITSLDCNSNSLTSLNVSSNTSLTDLNCAINQLTVLDVTALSALMSLSAGGNQLTSIDVTTCPNLNSLSIFDNQLTTIDVSQNSVLGVLNCYNNQLTNIDVSNNPLLFDFTCYTNSLTSLDVSNNPNIVYLFCHGNSISNLNLSQNTLLQWLRCNQNQLTSLDVSNNPALVALYCFNNQIDSLDLSNNTALNRLYCANNQLTRLNIQNGNNINLLAFDATTNALLTCIQVDDANYMNTTWATGKDAGASFSLSCGCSVPAPAGMISGSTFVSSCTNQLGIVYSIDTIAGASSYNWTLPPFASLISNADSNVVTVDYDAYSLSGWLTVSGSNACGTGDSSSLYVNFKPIPVSEICRTTVDEATQKTLIEWQKPSESYIDAYGIYRDSSGTFTKIGLVTNSQFSSFLDTGSRPDLYTEKYKIAVLDSCGNFGDLSSPFEHETIRLYGSKQAGGIAKLYWNDYKGINDSSRYYNLLRDTIGNGPFNDTLASNISPAAYMNFSDSQSANYPNCRYVIEMVFYSNCTPSARMLLNKSTSRSNIKNKTALFDSSSVGINQLRDITNGISIYPNPAKDFVSITSNHSKIVSITLLDVLGKIIIAPSSARIAESNGSMKLSLQGITSGLYILRINTNQHTEFTSIVVN